jgi:hypothetical protein
MEVPPSRPGLTGLKSLKVLDGRVVSELHNANPPESQMQIACVQREVVVRYATPDPQVATQSMMPDHYRPAIHYRPLPAFGVTFFLVVLQDGACSHFLGPFSVTTTFACRLQDVFVLALFLWADASQMLTIGHKNEAVIVRSQPRRSPPFCSGLPSQATATPGDGYSLPHLFYGKELHPAGSSKSGPSLRYLCQELSPGVPRRSEQQPPQEHV